ncbi:MAG: sigma-70 family RNA polymerase sigma factor [Armatimonadetes bacterium]|nr:sigma-70 family RNA polymerase sigma factor [Armatimonadota bacterium]
MSRRADQPPTLEPDRVVAEHAGAVGRFVTGLVDDPEAVTDLVQEVFIRAWRGWAVVQPTDIRPWLKRIALNVVREHRRSPWNCRVTVTDDPPSQPARESDRPEQAAVTAERVQRIRLAIAHLPPAQAEAVRLHCLVGETYESMEALLGVPRSTLRSRVLAAGERLRAELADLEEAP